MNICSRKTIRGAGALAVICWSLSAATAQTATSRVVSAANTFLSTLDQKQRQKVQFSFDDEKQRANWSNFPTLLSRLRSYAVLRIGGALFAVLASVGWIAERLLYVHNPLNAVVDMVMHYAVWIAVVLFLISLVGRLTLSINRPTLNG
jgi:hypothetical protein